MSTSRFKIIFAYEKKKQIDHRNVKFKTTYWCNIHKMEI